MSIEVEVAVSIPDGPGCYYQEGGQHCPFISEDRTECKIFEVSVQPWRKCIECRKACIKAAIVKGRPIDLTWR